MLTTAQVTAIQQSLKEAGFFYQEVNGQWDEHTTQGYRNFCATVLNYQNSRFIQQPYSWDVVPAELRGDFVQPASDELNAVNPDEIVEAPAPEYAPEPVKEDAVQEPEAGEQVEAAPEATEENAEAAAEESPKATEGNKRGKKA